MKKCKNCGGSIIKKPPTRNKQESSSKIINIVGEKLVPWKKKEKI